MSKSLTKAQLAAQLEALRVERQALLTRIAELEAREAQASKLVAELSAPTKPARPAYVRTERTEPSAYQIACQKARELAMRTGRSVKVTVS